MTGFDASLLVRGEYHDWLLAGLRVSGQLTAIAFAGALPLGIALALLRTGPSKAGRALATGYVEAVRNVPLLAQLLFWYFGAPELLPAGWRERLYQGNVEFTAAVVGLMVYTSAYLAEDVRSGLRSLPRGQLEAARSLGLGYVPAMRHVLLPQALRIIVPPVVSQLLNLWMNSSVTTVIGAGELIYQAARVESASFRSTEAFAFATVAYLSVSLLLMGLGAWFSRRYPVRAA